MTTTQKNLNIISSFTPNLPADSQLVSNSNFTFDIQRVRQFFPILNELIYGKPLIYLDSAATTQKPQQVIDAMSQFFLKENANVHRGVYYLSEQATEAYESARIKVQHFLNAEHPHEIIFVRGATEAINLVAHSYGKTHIREGDEILITMMEHHSNIVPWQMLCQETGARLCIAPINPAGELLLDEIEQLIGPKTKLVAITHVSNVLGTINPIQQIVQMAHAWGARVLVDGAQASPHLKIDLQQLGCDFYVLSGHKMYGPTGIGVLYGRSDLLEEMIPYQSGGNMILSVSFEKTVYNKLPYKFEAGTPNIAGAIGLAAAIEFLNHLDYDMLKTYEEDLFSYSISTLSDIPGLKLIGTAPTKIGVFSFLLDNFHPHDISTILDREGIAIRAGHHCAQPLMNHFGVAATARISLACYNTRSDIDALIAGFEKVREIL